jgi:hypothetical protein
MATTPRLQDETCDTRASRVGGVEAGPRGDSWGPACEGPGKSFAQPDGRPTAHNLKAWAKYAENNSTANGHRPRGHFDE